MVRVEPCLPSPTAVRSWLELFRGMNTNRKALFALGCLAIAFMISMGVAFGQSFEERGRDLRRPAATCLMKS
jgi:hypothetical protein